MACDQWHVDAAWGGKEVLSLPSTMRPAHFVPSLPSQRPAQRPMELTLIAAAQMASYVYEAEAKSGRSKVAPPSVRGYAVQKWVHEQGSGFTGAIYTAPGLSHVVLAFAGTNIWSKGDLKADIDIVGNEVPIEQMIRANRLYISAKEISQNAEIIVVGHSLGGGLAQFIAATYGLRGATFNAPPMGAHLEGYSKATGQKNVDEASLKERIINFRAFFDIVSVGSYALDAIKIVTSPLMGVPRFNPAWSRHLGRVVHLGPGAGLHGMDDMVSYISRQPYAEKAPWNVR